MIPKLCDIHEEVMMDVGSKETEGVLASVKSECIRKESEKGVCGGAGLGRKRVMRLHLHLDLDLHSTPLK